MTDSVRLDKWLWAARFFKTRSLATAACDGGKVDVNDQAAKPAKPVRAGDTVRVTTRVGRRVARVLALGGYESAEGPSRDNERARLALRLAARLSSRSS